MSDMTKQQKALDKAQSALDLRKAKFLAAVNKEKAKKRLEIEREQFNWYAALNKALAKNNVHQRGLTIDEIVHAVSELKVNLPILGSEN